MQWFSWLRHSTTSRRVTVSSPDGASGISGTGICNQLNPSGRTMALGSTQPDRNEYQEYFLGSRSSRCLKQSTLPPSSFDILEIGETQPPGTLRALPGLYMDCFTLLTSNIKFNVLVTEGNNSLFSYTIRGRSHNYINKIIYCQGFHSVSMNISSTAGTYIAWAFKAAPFLKAL